MWCAFHKLNLSSLLRPEPLDFPHDLFSDRMLMLALAFWQVYERHLVRFKVLQLEYLRAVELIKPGYETFDEIQLAILAVFTNQQFTHSA